jgi:hypothetical protein
LRRAARHLALFGLLAGAACAPAARAPEASGAAPAPPPRTVSPASPDGAEAEASDQTARQAIVDATLKQVAAARELPATGSIRSRVIGRDALFERMKRELVAEVEPELLQGSTELMFSLGAVGADLDYLATMLKLLGTQLAGYYDPRTKELVVMDDLGLEAEQVTLWHELIHGLQDQHYDLKPLLKWQPGRGDGIAATHSLAEGDATSGMMDLMLLPRGQDALDAEGAFSSSMGVLEAMPEIASVPTLLKRSIVAPYVDGLAFVHALRRAGGWAAVDGAWRSLPTTTEQILHPEKYLQREPAEVIAIPLPPAGGPSELLFRDVLGEQAVRLMLEEWVPKVTAASAAAGWAGDAVAVFASGDRRAVAIHLRYDDETNAREGFAAIARGVLRPEPETWSADKPPPMVAVRETDSAVRKRDVCHARAMRGPFAAVWRGRDLGVALGPYQRTGSVTRSAADCALATAWAERILAAR